MYITHALTQAAAAAAAAAIIATHERIECNHGDGIQYGIIVASHWFGDFTLQ